MTSGWFPPEWSCRHDQSTVRIAGKGRDRGLDGGGIVQADCTQLDTERRRRLDGGELTDASGNGGIPQNRRARHARRDFLEQFEPFRADSVFEGGEPGGIAARPRQATNQARANRVDDATKHDRHCAGRLLHCGHVIAGIGNDNVRRKRHQFHRMSAANVDTARGPADVKARIAAVGPAQFRQPLDESGELSPPSRIALVRTQEHTDPPHPLGLLRTRDERPRDCRAAEKCDEFPPPHGAYPKAKDHGTKYSRCWGGSVARASQ